jgi:cellulose synthase/poly-beta-1,6-N-acetylglucosamine synthase-like glycosyltransferase
VEGIVARLIEVIFWLSAIAVVWAYAGYPLLITLLAHWRPHPHRQADIQPSVSIVVPAYNEEQVIADKLDNLLELDYPEEKREVMVVADGSTDRTPGIVELYGPRDIQLLFEPERRGKAAAMERGVGEAHGEILVFSDANTMMEPSSLRAMVRNFADPQVACVSGVKRILSDRPLQAQGESAYWRYEARLKEADSLVSTAIGAVGEFFAVRKSLYRPMEEDTLLEDFVLSMRLVMDGWRVVYEPAAISWESASPSLSAEWGRRARNTAGGFQAMERLGGIWSPRHAFVAFQFLSHKVLRWTAPFSMLLALAAAGALYAVLLYRVLFWGQVAFYSLALAGWLTTVLGWPLRWLRIMFYFCFANATALGGAIRYLFRTQSVLWTKVR